MHIMVCCMTAPTIPWVNFDSISATSCDIDPRTISLEMLKIFVLDMSLKNTHLRLQMHPHRPMVNVAYMHPISPGTSWDNYLRYIISLYAKEAFPTSKVITSQVFMMTASNGNLFRVTGPLRGDFTGHRWIPHAKASDAEVWGCLWSAPE